MAQRKYVGDYIVEKVSVEYSKIRENEIEVEKQHIADFFSAEIVTDMLEGLTKAEIKQGVLMYKIVADGSMMGQSLSNIKKAYESTMPKYLYSALAKMKEELERKKDSRITLSEVKIAQSGEYATVELRYNFSNELC